MNIMIYVDDDLKERDPIWSGGVLDLPDIPAPGDTIRIPGLPPAKVGPRHFDFGLNETGAGPRYPLERIEITARTWSS